MSADLSQKVTHIEDLLKDLSSQISDVQNQVATCTNQVTKLQTNMTAIYTSIVGDEKFGHKGLVNRVGSLEDTKKKLEKKAGWVYGYIVGAGTIITLFVELIKMKFK